MEEIAKGNSVGQPPVPSMEDRRSQWNSVEPIEKPPFTNSVWDDHRVIQGMVDSMNLRQIPREEASATNVLAPDWYRSFGDLELVDIDSDGHCQFKAVSKTLFGTQDHYLTLRWQTARYMLICRSRFEPVMPRKFTTFEKYCEAIATTTEWGDHSSLQILAEIYRVKFQVLSTLRGGSKFELIQPIPEDPLLDTIFIAHFGEYHYQSIKPNIGVVEEEDSHANQVKPNQIGEKRPNAFTSKTKSTKRKKKTKNPASRYIISFNSFRIKRP